LRAEKPVTSEGAKVADMTRLGEEARVVGSIPSPAWTARVWKLQLLVSLKEDVLAMFEG
jgi:hypothetical protein